MITAAAPTARSPRLALAGAVQPHVGHDVHEAKVAEQDAQHVGEGEAVAKGLRAARCDEQQESSEAEVCVATRIARTRATA